MKVEVVVAAGMHLVLVLAVANAGERELKRSNVPKAVLEAAAARLSEAVMVGFSVEEESGKTVYEVRLEVRTRRVDLDITPDGKVLSEERTIARDELPDAVRKSLASSRYARAKVRRIEEVIDAARPDAPTYELVVEQAGRRHELVFSHTGELVGAEAKTKGEKD